MDIKGGKAYLTDKERAQSKLDSPIDLAGFPIGDRLREVGGKIERLELILHSDPQDYLPQEKGAVRPELDEAYAQRRIYSEIGHHMLLEGQVDMSTVIDLL